MISSSFFDKSCHLEKHFNKISDSEAHNNQIIFTNHMYYICKYSSCIILSDSMLKYQAEPGTLVNSLDNFCVKTALRGYKLGQIHKSLMSCVLGASSIESIIFVSVGTNDAHDIHFNLDSFKRQFTEFKLFLAAVFPRCKIVLVSLTPRILPRCFDNYCCCSICRFLKIFDITSLNSRLTIMNSFIKANATEHSRFYFLDIFSRFQCNLNNGVKGVLAVDGLHPGRFGNNLIDREISELFKTLRY